LCADLHFCISISSVRLCWELEEPEGPKGLPLRLTGLGQASTLGGGTGWSQGGKRWQDSRSGSGAHNLFPSWQDWVGSGLRLHLEVNIEEARLDVLDWFSVQTLPAPVHGKNRPRPCPAQKQTPPCPLRVDHPTKWTTLMKVVHLVEWSTLTRPSRYVSPALEWSLAQARCAHTRADPLARLSRRHDSVLQG
jgi:hypothetical protein